MTDTTTITDEQAQAMRDQLALYERRKAYQAALLRDAVFEALLPIVNSDAFQSVHQQITALRETGPKDDAFFGIGIDAVFHGMTSLGRQVASWTTPVDPDAPVTPAPTPTTEGTGNGE